MGISLRSLFLLFRTITTLRLKSTSPQSKFSISLSRIPVCRAVSTTGLSWSEPEHHEQVYCPTCQSSIQRLSPPPEGATNRILYSGPGGPGRSHLTIRLSYDEGKTWPVAKVLYESSAAYSDLVVLPDGTIGCLFERDNYGKITFARFTLEWLTGGEDGLTPK